MQQLISKIFTRTAAHKRTRPAREKLYYYSRSNRDTRSERMEVDFLTLRQNKVCPVEVKSGDSRYHSSLDKFCEKFGRYTGQPYVLCRKDLRAENRIVYLPLFMAMFL